MDRSYIVRSLDWFRLDEHLPELSELSQYVVPLFAARDMPANTSAQSTATSSLRQVPSLQTQSCEVLWVQHFHCSPTK